jgi:hypothetical protein
MEFSYFADLFGLHQYPDDSEGFGECFLVGQAHLRREKSAYALIYSHVTPYGTFRLDMNERISFLSELEQV